MFLMLLLGFEIWSLSLSVLCLRGNRSTGDDMKQPATNFLLPLIAVQHWIVPSKPTWFSSTTNTCKLSSLPAAWFCTEDLSTTLPIPSQEIVCSWRSLNSTGLKANLCARFLLSSMLNAHMICCVYFENNKTSSVEVIIRFLNSARFS